jgi:predicted ATP-grasp superfamily ATP-dependent carboligase
MAREAGWVADVIDLFGDEDTRCAARTTTALTPNRYFDFDGGTLFGAMAAHQCLSGPAMVVVGSAFERAPAVLARLAQHYRVLGCDAEVYHRLRDLPALFDLLRRREGISSPTTQWSPPPVGAGWLKKQVGGSGGYHVTALTDTAQRALGSYFQQRHSGHSRSALFIANGRECRYYGCAEHLRWHTRAGFRYEGARRLSQVSAQARAALERIGAVLTARLGLRGCFGIDFLASEGRAPVLLDINPRPTATLELWPDRDRMFDAHIAACTDQTLLYSSPQVTSHRAHLVLYADAAWTVTEQLAWPSWVADRPCRGTFIARGAPLCTVQGDAADDDALLTQLAQRYDALRDLLGAAAQAVLAPTINIRIM